MREIIKKILKFKLNVNNCYLGNNFLYNNKIFEIYHFLLLDFIGEINILISYYVFSF